MDIIGVDYSGAKVEGKTWVALGHLPAAGHLIIDRVQPVLRNDLLQLLQNAAPSTVAALDFPFGVPAVFHKHLGVHAMTMKDVWGCIVNISLDQYRDKCESFGTHPKREGDKLYSVSMSALNSRLVPMTYHGIKMLHKLDKAHANRWWIPPLDSGEMPTDRVALLEVMPGAFLQSIGFDHATIKGFKNAAGSLDTRDGIIKKLSEYAKIKVQNLLDFQLGFRANEDCFDSVIAAVAAASWASGQIFRCPESKEELDAAPLEGWLYAPKPQP